MYRAKIAAGTLLLALAGRLSASMLSANPAAALFADPLSMAELCRTSPEMPLSAQACTFLTSSAMVDDLQFYAAAATGSADLMMLLEISE